MTEPRKYSIDEIDTLRKWTRELIGIRGASAHAGGGYHYNSIAASTVEEELRTYMLHGISPEEVEERYRKIEETFWDPDQ